MRLATIIDISLVDVPGIPVTVLFTAGCNYDCPFCQNAEIIPMNSGDKLSIDEIIARARGHLVDGFCITGGEPTIHGDLPALLEGLRAEGDYHINLNTQGSVPSVLEKSLPFLDSIWFDIKTVPERYQEVCRTKSDPWPNVQKSISLIMESDVEFWPRTTYAGKLMSQSDIIGILKFLSSINFQGDYTIQNYMASAGVRPLEADLLEEPQKTDIDELVDTVPDGINLRIEWR
ncbi:MAG: anaerobic ribonucleoside-triphosphate reductase activating protein [Candidatus Thorarchaeota archaeon]